MKLRIHRNSLRLRVSRSELDRLIAQHQLEETIRFGPEPDAKLTYALEVAAEDSATSVRYSQKRITVVLHQSQLQTWLEEGQVGIYSSVSIGPGEQLELIVEKDFACLDRSEEENADAFSNPRAGAVC